MSADKSRTEKDKELILSIIKYALLITIVLFVIYLGVKILWILFPVIIGFILAYISNSLSTKIYRLFSKKSSSDKSVLFNKRGFKTLQLFSFFLLLMTLILFLVLIIIALIAQVRNLVSFINSSSISFEFLQVFADKIKDFSNRLGGFLPESTLESINSELLKIQDNIIIYLPKLATSLLNALLGIAGNLPLTIFQFVVVILSGYYFIKDRKAISGFIQRAFPSKEFVNKITVALSNVFSSLFRVVGGYIFILTITFVEALIGLTIIRMPYAFILALVVTIIDILPAVGASTCFVPIAIYMFAQGRIWEGVVALAFVGIIIAVRSFIEPKIIGQAMKLHPFATLIAMILGVSTLGFIGFIAGPALLVLVLGIVDSFGFESSIRKWTGKILNKIANSERIISDVHSDESSDKKT